VRVLTIAHNAVALSNRQRVDALRRVPEVEVTLLTPPWWYEEGRRVDARSTAQWRVGRTLFTGNGTRHIYLSSLLQSVRTCTPDVIDLFEEPFSLVALQTLLARNLLAPHAALVVYSAVNVERTWRCPYRLIERVVLRNADGAHAPNSDVPPILHRRGLHGPAQVIPLGVDADRFASAAPLQLPDIPRPRIGFLGRFEAVKGLDVLLQAFALLRASDGSLSVASRRAHLDVPASVPTSSPAPSSSSVPEPSRPSVDASSRSSVAASRASLVLAGDGSLRGKLAGPGVHVLPPLPFDQVPAFLKSLDVLVLPSVTILPLHREQFGRVLVEAMAAGVPVIGSSSGAIPEVIGDAGLIVSESDASALAHAIDQVLADAALRARLIDLGRQRVASHFTWQAVAEQSVALFRSAMLHRRHATAQLEEVRA
jgi:glycosyltransferase involved in cell wall biosynthesis